MAGILNFYILDGTKKLGQFQAINNFLNYVLADYDGQI